MERPLISVCIPTRNRCDYLRDLLACLSLQAAPWLEVVVSDNASTDATGRVVAEFQGAGLNLRYERHGENIGLGRNVASLPRISTGDYLWFIGDDDVFEEGALAQVAQVLRETRPDVLLANYGVWNNSLTRAISAEAFPQSRGRTDVALADSDVVNLRNMTFLGFLVLRRDPESVACLERNAANLYPHCFALMPFVRSFNWRCVPRLCIRQRAGPDRSPHGGTVFMESFPPLVSAFGSAGVPAATLRAWKGDFFRCYVLRSCIGLKIAAGRSDWKLFRSVAAQFAGEWRMWFVFAPAYVLPVPLLSAIKRRVSWKV